MSNESVHLTAERAARYRQKNQAFARWAAGSGVVLHSDATQVRVFELAERLAVQGRFPALDPVFEILSAADRLTNMAMWLVVHLTYVKNVYLDGRDLDPGDFKNDPEGHTGGALNIVPAYVGYLAANALSGKTRGWLMGQGHCVAAIDSVNLLVGNMTPRHAERYSLTEEGLTRFVRDFYSYEQRPDGRQESPLGSHVNPNTAGGLMEGGYLGFAELSYVHMPLPGEELVVFLSDGAFEEQRGSDWISRWWRPSDSGFVMPFMIANGRRIDQRTTVAQQGGVDWFRDHLKLNGFDPIDIDGRDPAAFAWGVLEMMEREEAYRSAEKRKELEYPVPVPYAVAETIKGFGFVGAGTNRAHNLPLSGNPSRDSEAAAEFNRAVRTLWLERSELMGALAVLNNHDASGRPRERDHGVGFGPKQPPLLPVPQWRTCSEEAVIPMQGVDRYFCEVVAANPGLRPRVGNPDELQSNRMNETLERLKHRVTAPERDVLESVDGKIITALNEEAVVCAAFGNKSGINLVVTYEAFAVKMLGAVRQELIFSRHQTENGGGAGWLSVPIFLTSHTWENGKNEISHQDPTLSEAMLSEMSDVSRVVFPADYNTAVAVLREVYSTRGQVWAVVAPKRALPVCFNAEQAETLAREGVILAEGAADAAVQLIALGAYQLLEARRAFRRLVEKGVSAAVLYCLEPGRLRNPRDEHEARFSLAREKISRLFPSSEQARIFLTHCRPEAIIGALRSIDNGPRLTRGLGFINRGGTLNVSGMLFANRCTWAHAVHAAAEALGITPEKLLSAEELKAVGGQGDPGALLEEHG